MDLENRISILVQLGKYMQSDEPSWTEAKTRAFQHNPWFVPDFIDLAVNQIVSHFLQESLLLEWAAAYTTDPGSATPKKVGIVMAGNIPLVGFHDFLCCFISGHRQVIKLSSKDAVLFPALLEFLYLKDSATRDYIQTDTLLKGLDAYIATGSNNSARYFEYYFRKYPSLIRRNRTSVAILDGNETTTELEKLADDVFLYFGLGCRNVTQIRIPEHYDFLPLLKAFRKYEWMADHNKFKNNYDYRLSLAILNKIFYMTNDCILLIENESPFSAISVLHYSFYKEYPDAAGLLENVSLQCVVGKTGIPFGKSQEPGLYDYADGEDTMKFLHSL